MTNNNITDETIATLREASGKRQLLLAQIDNDTIENTIRRIQENSNVELRQSKRLKAGTTTTEPIKISDAKDSIFIEGMEGTLGYNVRKHALTFIPIKKKEKYFHSTCTNGILDISLYSSFSFIKSVNEEVAKKIVGELSCSNEIVYRDKNLPCQVLFKQISNTDSLQHVIGEIKRLNFPTDDEENVQNIYLFICNMHKKRQFMFHKDRIELYSEEDYIVKFWSPIFETFFGDDEHLFLHWGDTQPQTCKEKNLKMKLDMRFLITKHGKVVMDGANCEYAAKATSSKLFNDRLKLALGAKVYLNEIIKSGTYLDEYDIRNLKIPYLQIMGFKAVLSILKLKDKGLYVVEDIMKFQFPTTKKQLRKGCIADLVKALSLIKHLLKNIEEAIEEGKFDHEVNKMTKIINETCPIKNNNNDWTTDISSKEALDNDIDEEEEGLEEEEEEESIFDF